MFQKTRGLVLRETEYKDNDKLLTLLTEDHGLMTVKARGVKKSKSLLKSACQILTYSEFTVLERQGYHTITEAEPIEMFSALRTDLELLSLGSYFAQATEVLSQEDFPNPELLRLTLYCLYALCKGRTKMIVKAAFELRLAAFSGYAPDLSGCAACGSHTPAYFCVSDGSLLCADCRPPEPGALRLPVSADSLAAMRYILSCEPARLCAFTLGESAAKELADVSETYLLTQLERGFYTLDFYKSLQIT